MVLLEIIENAVGNEHFEDAPVHEVYFSMTEKSPINCSILIQTSQPHSNKIVTLSK